MLVIAVGSENKAKLEAASLALGEVDVVSLFQDVEQDQGLCIRGYTVESGVSAQPMSAEETRRGALERARRALRRGQKEAKVGERCVLGIGMEGGLERIGEEWYECGWMAVVDEQGKVGLGTTARAPVSQSVVKRLQNGEELSEVVDDLSGQTDVRSGQGYMGMITQHALPRHICYTHGLYFALAPFISPSQYWD